MSFVSILVNAGTLARCRSVRSVWICFRMDARCIIVDGSLDKGTKSWQNALADIHKQIFEAVDVTLRSDNDQANHDCTCSIHALWSLLLFITQLDRKARLKDMLLTAPTKVVTRALMFFVQLHMTTRRSDDL